METTSFEVLEIRASGAYATVCRARRKGDPLQREVAVKALRATLVDNARALMRTRDEARMLARLSHPHIVKVEELLSLVLRVKSLLDGFLALLGAATLLLLGLVLLLSARLRRAEMRTLERIGAPPKVALQLYGLEFAVVLLLAALLGLAATGITLELITDPARILT